MSFERDLDVDLESQMPFSDSPEFDQATDKTSNQLLDLQNQLAHLDKLVTLLEARSTNSKATEKTCEKCTKAIETSTAGMKKLSELCRELNDLADTSNPAHVFTRDRVTRESKDVVSMFQDLQERFAKVNAQLNDEARAALQDEATETPPAAAAQRQEMVLEQDVINNEEFVYQQALIREREEEIANIEHGIQELNEIFQDLGGIVQEQGTMVDNIETNIYTVSRSTQDAAGELRKALRYQRSSGKKSCVLLTIIMAILLVVILGIVI